MAGSLQTLTNGHVSAASGTTLSTPGNVAPVGPCYILVYVETSIVFGAPNTPTISGGGLTYTITTSDTWSIQARNTLAWAYVPAGTAAFTVTADFAAQNQSNGLIMYVLQTIDVPPIPTQTPIRFFGFTAIGATTTPAVNWLFPGAQVNGENTFAFFNGDGTGGYTPTAAFYAVDNTSFASSALIGCIGNTPNGGIKATATSQSFGMTIFELYSSMIDTPKTNVPNNQVGPQVLRLNQPSRYIINSDRAPVTDTRFIFPSNLRSFNSGPTALRRQPQPILSDPSLTFTNSELWTCPPGVFAIQVDAWGGGGAGAGGQGVQNRSGGGGGGGAYARLNSFLVTPGQTYSINIPTVALGHTGDIAGDNGGDAWFNSPTTLLAKGGQGGQIGSAGVGGVGGTGGLASQSIGDVAHNGGNGGAGVSGGNGGGGGGGSAGFSGNGGVGAAGIAAPPPFANGGAAGTGTPSGANGGIGGGLNLAGGVGQGPGAGSGGSGRGSGGANVGAANGATGQVTITPILVLTSNAAYILPSAWTNPNVGPAIYKFMLRPQQFMDSSLAQFTPVVITTDSNFIMPTAPMRFLGPPALWQHDQYFYWDTSVVPPIIVIPTDTNFIFPTIPPNRFVGPAVLRNSTPQQHYYYDTTVAPAVDNNFIFPVILPNSHIGPQVLQEVVRQYSYIWDNRAPVTDTTFIIPVNPQLRQVGPTAQRQRPQVYFIWDNKAPITDTNFGLILQRSPNIKVGPQALRRSQPNFQLPLDAPVIVIIVHPHKANEVIFTTNQRLLQHNQRIFQQDATGLDPTSTPRIYVANERLYR